MDIFYDFYRTRLYLPLLMLLAIWLFVPKAKPLVGKLRDRLDFLTTSRGAIILGTVSLIFCVMAIYNGKSWGGDFSQYFAQARAIATGTISEWYDRNQFIINTSCDGIGADVYPWFWAVCLAPVYKILGYFPYTPLKIVEGVAVAGTTITLVYIYRRRMRLSYALFLAAFTAWNGNYIIGINTIEADIICLFVVIETINIIDLYNLKYSWKSYGFFAVLAGLFIYLSVQTKTMAKGVLLALICYDILLIIKGLSLRLKIRNPFTVGDENLVWTPIRVVPYIVYFVLTRVTDRYSHQQEEPIMVILLFHFGE